MSKVRTSALGLIYLQTVSIAIATALVVLRLYVRSSVIRNIGLDDFFIVFALALAIASSATIGLLVHYGLASSSLNVLPRTFLDVKFRVITDLIILMSTMLTRISICFFLLRIFGSRKPWRFGLYTVIAFAVLTSISTAILVLLGCKPLHRIWNHSVKGACWSGKVQDSIALYQGGKDSFFEKLAKRHQLTLQKASAVFCDWILALLPIVFMWDVQMPAKFKATICVLMGMGTFSGICALARSFTSSHIRTQLLTDVVPWLRWMMLEQNIGIIAACIPTLKPLLRKSFHFHWPEGLRRRGGKAVDDDEVQLHTLTYTSKTIAVGIRQVDLDYAQAGEQTRDEAG